MYAGGLVGYVNGNMTIECCGVTGDITTTYFTHAAFAQGNKECNIIVRDCFANVNSYYFCTDITVENCLWIKGSNKYYLGTDFSNWVISTTNMPLPNSLSWMATTGEKSDLIKSN